MAVFCVPEQLIPFRYTNGCCTGSGCGDCGCCTMECRWDDPGMLRHIPGDPQAMLRAFLKRPGMEGKTSILQLEPFNKHPAIQALTKSCVSTIKIPRNASPPLKPTDWNPYSPKGPARAEDMGDWVRRNQSTPFYSWFIEWQVVHRSLLELFRNPGIDNAVHVQHGLPLPAYYLAACNQLYQPRVNGTFAWELWHRMHCSRYGRRLHCTRPGCPCFNLWGAVHESWRIARAWADKLRWRNIDRDQEKVNEELEEQERLAKNRHLKHQREQDAYYELVTRKERKRLRKTS